MTWGEFERSALAKIFLLIALTSGGVQTLDAQQEPEEIRIQEALFNLPLGYHLTPNILELFSQTSRSADFTWLDPDNFHLALQIPRGHIIYRFDSSLAVLSMPPSLRTRGEYFALGDDVDLSEAKNLALAANLYKKKTALAPEGDRALADDAALTVELAPYADLFIIRAEQWLDTDASPSLENFVANVHAVAQAARSANPDVQLQIWLGRPREQDRLNVEKLYQALSRLAEEYPQDLQSCHLSRLDAWFDPQEGNNLLVQTLFFLRHEAFSPPGAPEAPLNFRVVSAGPGEVLLTWTDASSDELGFLLKRGQSPGQPPSRVTGLLPQPDVSVYGDSVPSPGAYYYRLCAYNSQGLSFFTDLQAVDTRGGRPNLPPRFEAPPSASVYLGVPIDLFISATDPDGDPLRYSLAVHPAGMIIQAETGMISWLPSAAGRYAVSVTASDGQAADFLWFEIEVQQISQSSD